jgi:hypothetical protein
VRNDIAYAGEWRGDIADRLFVTAGVRHDDNDTFEDFTTWRTTATRRLPEIGLRPHAGAGTAVKAPPMFEQYGTIPLFCTFGLVHDGVVARDGQPAVTRVASLKFSYDERVEDGLYAAKALQYLCSILQDPASQR